MTDHDEIMRIGNPADKSQGFWMGGAESDGTAWNSVGLLHEDNRTGKLCLQCPYVREKGGFLYGGDYRWHGKAPDKQEFDRAVRNCRRIALIQATRFAYGAL